MADKQNWDLINKKNSIGPALGMAMGKAIDLVIAIGSGKISQVDTVLTKKTILYWRDWIYEENNKKHQELLLKLSKEGDNKQDELEF